MIQGWTFLVGEIWALVLCAALLGMASGWLVFGRVKTANAPRVDVERYEKALQLERSRNTELVDKIKSERTRFAGMEKVFADTIKSGEEARNELESNRALLAERDAQIKELRSRTSASKPTVGSDGVVPLVKPSAAADA